MKETSLRHVGIVVSNLERSKAFYEEMGFLLWRWQREKWQDRELEVMKLMADDGGVIELIEKPWRPHVAITVPNIDRWENNVLDTNGIAYYLQDPDGNWLELVEGR